MPNSDDSRARRHRHRHAIVQRWPPRRLLGVSACSGGESAHGVLEEELGGLSATSPPAAIALRMRALRGKEAGPAGGLKKLGRVAGRAPSASKYRPSAERIVEACSRFSGCARRSSSNSAHAELVAVAEGGHGAHQPGQSRRRAGLARAHRDWRASLVHRGPERFRSRLRRRSRDRVESGTYGSSPGSAAPQKDGRSVSVYLSETAATSSERRGPPGSGVRGSGCARMDNAPSTRGRAATSRGRGVA